MESKDSRLSRRSKNLFWSLRQQLDHYKVNLQTLVFKLFSTNRTALRKHEFVKIVRFGDLKVTFDEIDAVFEELKENDLVSVASIEEELRMLQNPNSSLSGLEGLDGMQESMLAVLKEVKGVLVRENPHYIFDLYDRNKDECLDVEELNNLLIACCTSKLDVEVRKKILKTLLKSLPGNKLPKKKLLEMFGL